MAEILRADRWGTNARMIAEAVVPLGYLEGSVLDATYGHNGGFWMKHQPVELVTNDMHAPGTHFSFDYRSFPAEWECSFDTVVYDPPYRMSGRRDRGEKDARFGTAEYRSNTEILSDLVAGAVECYRVTRRYLLVKCQDQVNGGRMRWQTDLVTRAIENAGGRKIDRFDLLRRGQGSQPLHRRQITARSNYSTLLVFEKPRSR